MMIFDAHAHLGRDVSFDVEGTESLLLETMDAHGVHGALVQPFIPRPYLEDTRAIHDRIDALTRAHTGRFYGMASICPHLREAEVAGECMRCVRELGFKGIKLATTAYGASPASADGMRLFEIASALRVPIMVHTGGGIFGAPHLLEKPARAFPSLPIVIAHGGGENGVDECIRLCKAFDNLFVEPSWINTPDMQKLYGALGAARIMFSSDMPQNTPAALAVFRAVFKPTSALEQALGKTAMAVFGIGA